MFIRTTPVRSPFLVPLPVLPHAPRSYPQLYGVKMINLILLASVLGIASLFAEVLLLLPMSLSGWLHFPVWLSLTLILLAISWCLGD
ncbi:MAG: hypothetical protein EAZ90_06275 [Oscillatoriales cyanobacterium]|nr:MAG: hypothetical protein EAZ94_02475 [Oscillatoriales cyanobacterium]TAE20813.1 MAG: hypothetical protein EAZ93_22620 [Oscillatoriales cyanobacterium]TAE44484.1 MAG: hypothetical protein EAZ90_06275 [Oscillatoriales cyanobacterium]TAE71177.1 MAG: hypothetical protein EAZ86_04085 [Oscillatoriales cyanobacterium]TAG99190.1 MAG: hypothetical protein EAZ19_01130 [Oscillatoriales cyanobacterium]